MGKSELDFDKDTIIKILKNHLMGLPIRDNANSLGLEYRVVKQFLAKSLVGRAIKNGKLNENNIEEATQLIIDTGISYKINIVDADEYCKNIDIDKVRAEVEGLGGKLEANNRLTLNQLCYVFLERENQSLTDSARLLGLGKDTVTRGAQCLNVFTKKTITGKWTEEEIDYLKKVRDIYSVGEIAEALGKPKSTVSSKISELGLLVNKQDLPEGHIKCIKCGEVKEYEKFVKAANKRGYGTVCKECHNARQRQKKVDRILQNSKSKLYSDKIEQEIKDSENKLFKCRVCGEEKLGSEFAVSRLNSSRRDTRCKKCKYEEDKVRKLKRSAEN